MKCCGWTMNHVDLWGIRFWRCQFRNHEIWQNLYTGEKADPDKLNWIKPDEEEEEWEEEE